MVINPVKYLIRNMLRATCWVDEEISGWYFSVDDWEAMTSRAEASYHLRFNF